MRYHSFIFESYAFDTTTNEASFHYSFDSELYFTEKIKFTRSISSYDQEFLNRTLFFVFMIAGISYYKSYPVKSVKVKPRTLSQFEASFFNTLYLHGLSQFLFENKLDPELIAKFPYDPLVQQVPIAYDPRGTVVLQSGGKDSLLLAELLNTNNVDFTCLYIQSASTPVYPTVLDNIKKPIRSITRLIDTTQLTSTLRNGAYNGHVPVTYITLGYALIDAILHGEHRILSAIGIEGEEPHAFIGNLPITHQWSKTWSAEKLFSSYVTKVLSPDLQIGSPLRNLSELKIAELFSKYGWEPYATSFSSCNIANYKQGHVNDTLQWCGSCPKCANSYLLFSAYIAEPELLKVFNQNLYTNARLIDTFKGLLGVENVMKPFECVGEVDELRRAYHIGIANGYTKLPFFVPESSFDISHRGPSQEWATKLVAVQ